MVPYILLDASIILIFKMGGKGMFQKCIRINYFAWVFSSIAILLRQKQ